MYKNEEEKLLQLKESYDSISIPMELLNDAVQSGYHKAKQERRKRKYQKKWMMFPLAAAVLLFGFLASIRISPVLAEYVSVIPGMEKVVELIRNDKGLMSALENNYVEKIGISEEHDGIRITIDSIIRDQDEMAIYYMVSTNGQYKDIKLSDIILNTAAHKPVPASGSFAHSYGDLSKDKNYSDTIHYLFNKPLTEKRLILTLEASEVDDRGEVTKKIPGNFTFPFTLKKEIQKKKTIELNKTVKVEGQKITVKDITISPMRVGVHLLYDPKNSKKIFSPEDIRLVDENGETWSGIVNGIISSRISDNEQLVYLQSNYFRKPKELYLQFNSLRALDKDELQVMVDPISKKILKAPKDGMFQSVEVLPDHFLFSLKYNGSLMWDIFDNHVLNDKGLDMSTGQTSRSSDPPIQQVGIYYDKKKLTSGPVTFNLMDYPSHIKGKVSIQIK